MELFTIIMLTSASLVSGQRPFFAGSRPIGIPELANKTTTPENSGLGDRFGEGDSTTQKLPLEAQGDRDLVDRLSKLPIDKQPFWLINWQALEEQRKHPQTYPQRPSPFVEPPLSHPNPNSNTFNSNSVPMTTSFGIPNSGFTQNSNFNNGNTKLTSPGLNLNSEQVVENNDSHFENTESRWGTGINSGDNKTTNVNSGRKPLNDSKKDASDSHVSKVNIKPSNTYNVIRPLADINDEKDFN